MKKITLSILLGFVFCVIINAQQDPQYTQYMYNMNVVNPAYAGSKETLSIGVLGRKQWTNLRGAPTTFTGSIHAPLGDKVGAGLSIIADKIGPVKEQNIYADFSYTLKTSEVGNLAFGIKAGVTLFNADLDLATVDPSDPVFGNIDATTNFNFGTGVFYYTEKFYVGLSMPNMLKASNLETQNGEITEVSDATHYFLTSGYVFDLNNNLKFKPSILLKATGGAPVSLDVSANFLFNERLELGASYRLDDAISGLINFEVSRGLRLGFAYDYTITNLGDFNNGSFEGIILWDILSSERKIKSPRFF